MIHIHENKHDIVDIQYQENSQTEITQHEQKISTPARSSKLSKNVWWRRYGPDTWQQKLGKYVIVGVTGVLVNNMTLFVLFQKAHLPLIVASALAVELAIISNFIWNDHWTFKRRGISLHRFVQFNLVSLGGLLISTGALWVLVSQLGLYYLVANLLAIALATAWNFVVNLYWTWGGVR